MVLQLQSAHAESIQIQRALCLSVWECECVVCVSQLRFSQPAHTSCNAQLANNYCIFSFWISIASTFLCFCRFRHLLPYFIFCIRTTRSPFLLEHVDHSWRKTRRRLFIELNRAIIAVQVIRPVRDQALHHFGYYFLSPPSLFVSFSLLPSFCLSRIGVLNLETLFIFTF